MFDYAQETSALTSPFGPRPPNTSTHLLKTDERGREGGEQRGMRRGQDGEVVGSTGFEPVAFCV
jgi:hypothetical protein